MQFHILECNIKTQPIIRTVSKYKLPSKKGEESD